MAVGTAGLVQVALAPLLLPSCRLDCNPVYSVLIHPDPAASAVVRKLASFTVSYVYFGRPLSPAVVLGACLVFVSVGFKAFWHHFQPQWVSGDVVDVVDLGPVKSRTEQK